MAVKAGNLNRRIKLQAPTPTRNDHGETVEAWTTSATVWAKIIPKTAKEFFDSDKITSEVDGQFEIRHRTDIKPDWRIELDDTATSPATVRTFAVVGIINPFDGRRILLIMFRELPSGEPV